MFVSLRRDLFWTCQMDNHIAIDVELLLTVGCSHKIVNYYTAVVHKY